MKPKTENFPYIIIVDINGINKNYEYPTYQEASNAFHAFKKTAFRVQVWHEGTVLDDSGDLK